MAEQSPDPWRLVWRFATGDAVLVGLVLAIALSVALTAWIPQQPSSDADRARWLSQVQVRFGGATSTLQALGLFNIVSSHGFRVLLALLSGCLILHLVEGVDRLRRNREIGEPRGAWKPISGWRFAELLDSLSIRRYRVTNASSFFQVDRWPWSGAIPLLTFFGALLLLISLLVSHLFGWHAEGLVLQEGDRRSLPGVDNWVALADDVRGTRYSPGVVAFVESSGPGVQVSAAAEDGVPLQLLLTPEAEPTNRLRIALTEDKYFAIPEAELIVRLTPRSAEPYTRVDAQLFSSPSGEIIFERPTDEGGKATFDVAGVTLTFVPAPYARVMTTHNPGRPLAALGLMILMLGAVGGLTHPERRFWLRERDASIEAAGPLPSWLLDGEMH